MNKKNKYSRCKGQLLHDKKGVRHFMTRMRKCIFRPDTVHPISYDHMSHIVLVYHVNNITYWFCSYLAPSLSTLSSLFLFCIDSAFPTLPTSISSKCQKDLFMIKQISLKSTGIITVSLHKQSINVSIQFAINNRNQVITLYTFSGNAAHNYKG